MKALHSDIPGLGQMPETANAGLWYDKYCNQWREIPEEQEKLSYWSLGENKQGWIDTVTATPVGNESEIKEICKRREHLAKGMNAEPQLFKTDWRFVTGLGQAHPVENGFAWHHSLGAPYLPGSSVKGMVRAWAEQWEKADEDETKRLFGPNDAGTVGSVIFFDALPVSPVRLETDIMTPHYSLWYSNGEAPGDWHDPVPIPFLTVAAGQIFQFIIAPRRPGIEADMADAKTAQTWLKDALEWIGAGAKTATGYGRMTLPSSSELPPWVTPTSDMKETEQSEAEDWLRQKIDTLRSHKDYHKKPEEDLWKKGLAEEWEQAPGHLKSKLLDLIKKKWKELNIDWNSPKTKSARNAKKIFDEWIRKNS